MEVMDDGLWQLLLGAMAVFGFQFILLLLADLLPEIVTWIRSFVSK